MRPLLRLSAFAFALAPVSAFGQMSIAPPVLSSPAPAGVQNAPEVETPGRNGVSTPEVLKEVKPTYTPEARAAKIEGMVTVSAVVRADGSVTNVRVVRSLDSKYGLDDQAVKAASAWTFKPAMRNGKPVAVRITIELQFTLKK